MPGLCKPPSPHRGGGLFLAFSVYLSTNHNLTQMVHIAESRGREKREYRRNMRKREGKCNIFPSATNQTKHIDTNEMLLYTCSKLVFNWFLTSLGGIRTGTYRIRGNGYMMHDPKHLRVAYIGGGSRGWAWKLMADLAIEPGLSGVVSLYDIDRQAAEHNQIIGNRISARPDAPGKWRYEVAGTLGEALTGADFVIVSILPGTFAEMAADVHLPERHGIYQSVGDTAGPGGIVRALRTIPMYAEIGRAIRDYAPQAWVISYTNPMTLCTKTLYHVFPEIKAFGCCHEVFGTRDMLAGIYASVTGDRDVKRSDVDVNVVGINHFTWFTAASCKGTDLFPLYREYIEEHYDEGFSEPGQDWTKCVFDSMNRVKFDLFLRYGYIAAAGDRHLAEFMPGDMYLKDPETVHRWNFTLTSVAWREKDLAERLEMSGALVSGKKDADLIPSGEEGVMQMKALSGLGRLVSNVNMPNGARQIGNLPQDEVVETNVVLERDSVRPIQAGVLPEGVAALTAPHVRSHALILRAGMHCDFGAALEALTGDPLVEGRIADGEAHALLTDMIRGTLAYLPKPWHTIY